VWLEALEAALRSGGFVVRRGGDFDRWDLEARGGALGGARARAAVEEHGGGRQLIRIRTWPRPSIKGVTATLLFAAFALGASFQSAWSAALPLSALAILLILQSFQECSVATTGLLQAAEILIEAGR